MDPLLKRVVARDRSRIGETECPDAEVLAAFIDGDLTTKERRGVEAHAAGCQRCADTLALSASAEDPALSATISHVVTADRWRRAYWTVPLATAATVAGLWIATSREAVAPTEPRLTAGKSSAGNQSIQTREVPPSVPGGGGSVAVTAPEEARQIQRSAPAARDQAAPREERGGAAGQTSSPGPQTTARTAESVALQSDAPAGAPASPPAAADATGRTPQASRAAFSEKGAVGGLRIVAPDMRTMWRASGSLVERSADGGATWSAEFNAPRAITTGAAVSAEVAWFAGEQGLVLRRSTTGWTAVNVQSTEPVVAIRSTSAESAALTLASGRTLQTTDGGQTWR